MKRLFAAAALLALAACSDGGSPVAPRAGSQVHRPSASIYYYPVERIFSTQTPESTLDATGGWEVGTRFTTTKQGMIGTMRFYKAVGETGNHTVRLWAPTGAQIFSASPLTESASGWQQTYSPVSVVIPPGTYIVSVNTNVKQVKTFAYFTNNGPIVRTYMTADAGAYGQPTGSRPATISGSAFFVDVDFTPTCDTAVDNPCP
jgi:hypothetical protein